jgi:hypothetical protein
MKVYRKKEKTTPGWGYWGDNGEIEVGISSAYVENTSDFQPDKPHYHKLGTVYILTLAGSGVLSVNNHEVEHGEGTLVRIDPGEVYHHVRAEEAPLSWFTFCTVKDPADKIIL